MSETEGDTGWLGLWQGAKSGVLTSTSAEVADARRRTLELIALGRDVSNEIAAAGDKDEHRISIQGGCATIAREIGEWRGKFDRGEKPLRRAIAFGINALDAAAPGVVAGRACSGFSGQRIVNDIRHIRGEADMHGNRIAQLKAP